MTTQTQIFSLSYPQFSNVKIIAIAHVTERVLYITVIKIRQNLPSVFK